MEIPLIVKLVLGVFWIAFYEVLKTIIMLFVPNEVRFKDISGDIALITGAGSGIGREIALQFAQRGIKKLVLMDINLKGLKETRELIENHHVSKSVEVHLYECDVSNRTDVYSIASKIKKDVGIVTILVNNAGVMIGNCFLDCKDEMIEKTFRVNTLAHFWICKAFLPDMKANNYGHLISVASAAGFMPCYKLTDYCASKSAVVKFLETLRMELECEGYDGIKTTAVAPYFINTGFYENFNVKFYPEMSLDWVTEKIISGILLNEEVVTVPKWLSLYIMLFGLIPYSAARYVAKTLDVVEGMDKFGAGKTLE